MRPRRAWLSVVALAALAAGCLAGPSPKPACPTEAPAAGGAAEVIDGATRAVVVTNKGEFAITLAPESAPVATANFVALAECGNIFGCSVSACRAARAAARAQDKLKKRQ